MVPSKGFTYALTVLGAIAFYWLCLHTDETGILAGSVLLLACALGMLQPRQAWLVAIVLGLAAPAAQLLAHVFGGHAPFPHGPVPNAHDWGDVAGACVALVFSTAGAAVGAVLGWGMGHQHDGPSTKVQ